MKDNAEHDRLGVEMTADHYQLRKARIAIDLSLAEVGDATGTPRAAVSLLEAGKWPEDEELTQRLTEFYERMGVRFGPEGQVTVLP